jgi:DNA-binding MarR family transcriptional regulator
MTECLETALIALRHILRTNEISSRALAKRCGLTPSQLILMQIVRHAGRPTPSFLARETSLSHATITALIDKLEVRGFVTRRRNNKDRRRVYIELTSTGLKILHDAPDSLQSRFEKAFGQLESWEQSFLAAALERTVGLLDTENLDAGPVLDVSAIGPLVE